MYPRLVVQRFLHAWAAGDHQGAESLLADGVILADDRGRILRGRDAVGAELAQAPARITNLRIEQEAQTVVAHFQLSEAGKTETVRQTFGVVGDRIRAITLRRLSRAA